MYIYMAGELQYKGVECKYTLLGVEELKNFIYWTKIRTNAQYFFDTYKAERFNKLLFLKQIKQAQSVQIAILTWMF